MCHRYQSLSPWSPTVAFSLSSQGPGWCRTHFLTVRALFKLAEKLRQLRLGFCCLCCRPWTVWRYFILEECRAGAWGWRGLTKGRKKRRRRGGETGDAVSPQDWPLASKVRKLWLNFHREWMKDKQTENGEKHIDAMTQRERIHKKERRRNGWKIKNWWKTALWKGY